MKEHNKVPKTSVVPIFTHKRGKKTVSKDEAKRARESYKSYNIYDGDDAS